MPTGLRLKLGALLLRAWQRRGFVAVLLLPITGLYFALLTLRRALYRLQWLQPQQVNCAVIVVGNAIVGGAGKTPTTIGMVRHLQGRGLEVGVVSRGYGRTDRSVCAVTPTSDAATAGDEPLLMARATQAPVFVAAQRYAAAAALLAAHPQTQVIVCDDGLQHYPLYRDLEVCVFDDRGVGNGWLLPSGPLREPWPRHALACVGQQQERLLVLHTGAQPAFAGFRAQRTLAPYALTQRGQQLAMNALPPTQPLLALAGIALPEPFFSLLRSLGLALHKTLPLPDHFDFAEFDITQLQGYQVLCTEKDAVKLWKFWPEALAVPLHQTLEPAFLHALDRSLDAVLAAKLSSSNGHQTA
jgi:tetraacyldisaccharide 4'-kinase